MAFGNEGFPRGGSLAGRARVVRMERWGSGIHTQGVPWLLGCIPLRDRSPRGESKGVILMSGQRTSVQLAQGDGRLMFLRWKMLGTCALAVTLGTFGSLLLTGRTGATTPRSHAQTANPTCLTATGNMGDHLTGCIQATPSGLTFFWSGYVHYSLAEQYVEIYGDGVATSENVACTLPNCTKSYALAPGEYTGRATLVSGNGAGAEIGFDLVVGPGDPPFPRAVSAPIIGLTPTPDSKGYWEAGADGAVYAYGDATSYGSLAGVPLNKPIVGIAATPDGGGYWLVASDGGIFTFGDARFYGSTGDLVLNKPIVGMASTPDGGGYWLVASDGGIFTFGDATFYGSTGSLVLNKPIVGMAVDLGTGGYWLVASDGGIFSFNAPFYGSTGNLKLAQPIVGMETDPAGSGYRFVASDGGVFDFNQPFGGSLGGQVLPAAIVGMASDGTGGYWLVDARGAVTPFGGATLYPSAG